MRKLLALFVAIGFTVLGYGVADAAKYNGTIDGPFDVGTGELMFAPERGSSVTFNVAVNAVGDHVALTCSATREDLQGTVLLVEDQLWIDRSQNSFTLDWPALDTWAVCDAQLYVPWRNGRISVVDRLVFSVQP